MNPNIPDGIDTVWLKNCPSGRNARTFHTNPDCQILTDDHTETPAEEVHEWFRECMFCKGEVNRDHSKDRIPLIRLIARGDVPTDAPLPDKVWISTADRNPGEVYHTDDSCMHVHDGLAYVPSDEVVHDRRKCRDCAGTDPTARSATIDHRPSIRSDGGTNE